MTQSTNALNPFDNIGVRTLMSYEVAHAFRTPETLFHYTTGEGMLGIAGRHSLRLTDVLFLNDWTEGTYGIDLLSHVMAEFMQDKPADALPTAIKVMEAVRNTAGYMRSAVFCLSDGNDLLNQWRDYGKDIVPYSLGFATSALLAPGAFNIPTRMVKILYDRDGQVQVLREALSAIYDIASALHSDLGEERSNQLVGMAANELVQLTYGFKHQSFASENEWRLLAYIPTARASGAAVEYRVSSLGLVPFFTLSPISSRLPITSATVGPTLHWSAASQVLDKFMRDNGYDVPTSASTSPIRR